jgi:hypothetical protein
LSEILHLRLGRHTFRRFPSRDSEFSGRYHCREADLRRVKLGEGSRRARIRCFDQQR